MGNKQIKAYILAGLAFLGSALGVYKVGWSTVYYYIKIGFALVAGTIGNLLGGWDGILISLFVLMGLDIFTGFVKGFKTHKLSSLVASLGLAKKTMMLVLVAICVSLDKNYFGDTGYLRSAAIMFYSATEGISVVENSVEMGLPVPKKLVDVLDQLKSKGDNGETENKE